LIAFLCAACGSSSAPARGGNTTGTGGEDTVPGQSERADASSGTSSPGIDDGQPADRADAGVDARPDGSAAGNNMGTDAGACGICDRTWVCNGFAQLWATEADGRCVNQVNRTGLRCDGILDGTTEKDVGTWAGDAQALTLTFRLFGTGTRVITCFP
jgi:hypothetical protein